MNTIRSIALADWGIAIERAVRIAVPLVVLIGAVIADLIVITYRAGRATGEAVALRSDQLAVIFRRVLVPAADAATVAAPPPAPQPQRQPQVAVVQPQRTAQRELEAMSQRQLMLLVGTRRKLSKRQLVAMASAA